MKEEERENVDGRRGREESEVATVGYFVVTLVRRCSQSQLDREACVQ
jgi:hypothetical protein